MPEKPERNVEAPEKPDRPSGNVALPPVDATPEEIAQALVRETPPQRQEVKEPGDS